MAPPLSGRRAEAARNDERILAAARSVFMADPSAPISAVAERAGVGIAALYRRYAGKEELLLRLYTDGIYRFLAEVEAALADDGDPWDAFRRFAHRSLEAGTGSLSYRFAGAFGFTDEITAVYERADAGMLRLIERTQAAGALRPDVGMGDLAWLFLPAYAIRATDDLVSRQLRHRFLAILLDGLHARNTDPLPGPAPDGDEYGEYWEELLKKAGKPGTVFPKKS